MLVNPKSVAIRSPELIEPGRVPSVPVRWKQDVLRLTDGPSASSQPMIVCPAIAGAMDLVTGVKGTLYGDILKNQWFDFTAAGDAVQFTDRRVDTADAFTVAIYMRPRSYGSGTSFGRIFHASSTSLGGVDLFFRNDTSEELSLQIDVTQSRVEVGQATWDPCYGQDQVFFITHDAGSIGDFWCHWGLVGHPAIELIENTTNYTDANDQITIGSSYGRNRASDGRIYYCIIDCRNWSTAEMSALCRDPWYWVEPA